MATPKVSSINFEGKTPKVCFVTDDSALEPKVTAVLTKTVVIEDGKGGVACFDISEINDLSLQLDTLRATDAPAVTTVDLTKPVEPAGDK